jgi:hypothetical protein
LEKTWSFLVWTKKVPFSFLPLFLSLLSAKQQMNKSEEEDESKISRYFKPPPKLSSSEKAEKISKVRSVIGEEWDEDFCENLLAANRWDDELSVMKFFHRGPMEVEEEEKPKPKSKKRLVISDSEEEEEEKVKKKKKHVSSSSSEDDDSLDQERPGFLQACKNKFAKYFLKRKQNEKLNKQMKINVL